MFPHTILDCNITMKADSESDQVNQDLSSRTQNVSGKFCFFFFVFSPQILFSCLQSVKQLPH